jgi:hypothetical protein
MRWLALGATHPWLRKGLALVAVVVVFSGGARLWTSVPPDAVHITITQITGDPVYGLTRPIKTIIYDRTIQSDASAQRLQRDFTRMPIAGFIFDPFAASSCLHVPNPYDTYALTWYRAGLPVEQASSDPTGCGDWQSDNVFVLDVPNAKTLYADIAAVVATSS